MPDAGLPPEPAAAIPPSRRIIRKVPLAVLGAGLALAVLCSPSQARQPARAASSGTSDPAPPWVTPEVAVRDAAGGGQEADPHDRNILLIIADDVGVDAATLYPIPPRQETAPPAPATPNLRALARRVILFRRAWATPSCSPTRATIFTGRYGFRTGVGRPLPRGSDRSKIPPLSSDELSLPGAFAATERGRRYAMALIGKWHLSMAPEDPNRHGWPYYAGADPTTDAGALHDFFNWPKVVNGVVRTSKTYATTDVVDEAIGRIREAKSQGRPYFLWVAFNAAHSPFHRPPDHLHTRHALPATGAPKRAYFEAMVESLDTEIGRLLAAVDLGETTVIFLGDNGTLGGVIARPHDPEHAKLSIYEDGIRVPLLIAGAGVATPGRMVDGLAQSVDLYPTILELAGVEPRSAVPPGTRIDGISLMPYVVTGAKNGSARRFAYSEQFHGGDYRDRFARAIRDERFKLIERSPDLERPERELFDLRADPFERTNLLERELGPAERRSLDELDRTMAGLLRTR